MLSALHKHEQKTQGLFIASTLRSNLPKFRICLAHTKYRLATAFKYQMPYVCLNIMFKKTFMLYLNTQLTKSKQLESSFSKALL